jgi:AAA domain
MAKMILGREIVARVLNTSNIRPYIDAGLSLSFMEDELNPAYAAVFQGQDIDAYRSILRHVEKYGKVMDMPMFQRSYPPEAYRIRSSSYDDRELTDLAKNAIDMYESEAGVADAQRAVIAGDHRGAAEIMMAAARKVLYKQSQVALSTPWDRKDFDLSERLAMVRKPGPGFGIEALDTQFPGFQDGQLISLIGRAKSTKTTVLIQSAYHAWFGRTSFKAKEDLDPRRTLFVSTEIPVDDVRDMLTCYGAGVNPGPYIASTKDFRLSKTDEEKVRDFWKREMGDAAEAMTIVQPVAKFTMSELEYQIERAEPEIIYIDGFYFMTDEATGRTPGSSWEAHDNLARDLKNLALRLKLPVVVTHQAREKQLGKAGGGIDDVSMMGGTGLRMASDMVFTLDKGEDNILTIKNTAIRRGFINTVKGEWDYETFSFTAYVAEADEDDEEGY